MISFLGWIKSSGKSSFFFIQLFLNFDLTWKKSLLISFIDIFLIRLHFLYWLGPFVSSQTSAICWHCLTLTSGWRRQRRHLLGPLWLFNTLLIRKLYIKQCTIETTWNIPNHISSQANPIPSQYTKYISHYFSYKQDQSADESMSRPQIIQNSRK